MSEYKILSEAEAIQYAKEHSGVFDAKAEIAFKEIGDGNINFVYHMSDKKTGKSLIFKQALPYVRIVGDSWPLTIDRSRIEAESMKLYNKLCPQSAPAVYFNDEELAVSIVEDLGYLKIMRYELMKMARFPLFPKQMGRFLAAALFYTSDLYLDPLEKKALIKKFSNGEMCKIVEDLVFTDPYFDAASNNVNPELLGDAREFWKDDALRLEVTELKTTYMTKAQCLIHGDLHTGSVFIDQKEMRVFDTEFAFYGPAGYDVGLLIANLLLNYASWEGRDDVSQAQIKDYREYLLAAVAETYGEFEKHFSENWEKDAKAEYADVKGYKELYLKSLLEESVGLGGCEVMRRVLGLAHVADLDSIEDLQKRAKAQKLAWKIGEIMVKQRKNIGTMSALIEMIRKVK